MNWRRKGNNVDVIARDSNDVPVARFTVNWPCVNQKYGSQFYSIVICFFFYYYLLLCFQAAHNHLAIPNERSRLRTNIRTSNTHRTIRRNKKQKTDGEFYPIWVIPLHSIALTIGHNQQWDNRKKIIAQKTMLPALLRGAISSDLTICNVSSKSMAKMTQMMGFEWLQ